MTMDTEIKRFGLSGYLDAVYNADGFRRFPINV
jgi:hypothetical protein